MKPQIAHIFSRCATLALALLAPLFLTQCETTGGTGRVAVEGELSTPAHGLARHEYPFDSKGNYREDWVRAGSNSSSRSRSSSSTSSSRSRTASSTVSTSSASSRSGSGGGSSSSNSSPAPTIKLTKMMKYHKVSKGDTLWGISRRYKVSVVAITRANGLKNDLIRPGETLKIPAI